MSYHMASYDEPLLTELVHREAAEQKVKPLEDVPEELARDEPVDIPGVEENVLLRHYLHLSQMNFGVDTGMYPLGSCTMKYNPRVCEEIAGWDAFTHVHPYQPTGTVQGCLRVMYDLEEMLCSITGMDAFTLQPAAGAQGEFTGLRLVHAYHEHQGDEQRREVILPDTAHGTNPASASMAGFKVMELPSTEEGLVDLAALKNTLSDKTACFMLTNPNTLGLFESDIQEIARLVHEAGALLYYDGANMNAVLGHVRPGDMGFDVVHLNLHKTFSTPHGGGGPGSGPVGVKKHLVPFLPVPRVVKNKDGFTWDYDQQQSIGKIRSFYGDFSVLLKAYVYIQLLGSDGLRAVADTAVLNANYLMRLVDDIKGFEVPYQGRCGVCKHEFVASSKPLANNDVRALDVAKRLLDYGFHPPTVYFPLIVEEALMIEPTESATQSDLDGFAEALRQIADEESSLLHDAPRNMPVGRVDEVKASREPMLSWKHDENQV